MALIIANEGVVLHDTLSITGLVNFDGIRVADFDAGLPEGALVWRQDGGNMTFQLADDNPLLGAGYFKMGGKVGWDWSLGYIDIPVDFSDATVAASEFYLNLGVLTGTVGIPATDQFLNVSISESDAPFDDNQANNGADVFGAGNEVKCRQVSSHLAPDRSTGPAGVRRRLDQRLLQLNKVVNPIRLDVYGSDL